MIDGPHSICPKCSVKHIKTAPNDSTYCRACKTEQGRVRRRLRADHTCPDDHMCEICGKSETELPDVFGHGGKIKSKWRLDHCHNSGMFRGFLCDNCNIGLGKFMDSPDLMKNAIAYLSRTSIKS